MKYLCYILHRLAFVVFTEIGASNQCIMGCLSLYTQSKRISVFMQCIDEFFSTKHDCTTGSQPA